MMQALRDIDDDRIRSRADKLPHAAWSHDEVEQLQTFLVGKIANSWQHADELMMHLATRLKRTPKDVRAKATELGYGACIDYNVARTHARPEQMPTTRGSFR